MLFLLSFFRFSGKFTFSLTPRMPLYLPFHTFSWLSDDVILIFCSHIHVLLLELIQSSSVLKKRCLALKIQDFQPEKNQRWPALNFSVLNSADSEKVRADHVWKSSDQRWCFSCFLNQHRIALENVKSLKQCCSALNFSGTSTQGT